MFFFCFKNEVDRILSLMIRRQAVTPMSHCSSVIRPVTRCFILVTMLFASLGLSSLAQAQESNPPAKTKAVPTLESLPHSALPRGVFKGWCGQNDRYLLDVDGQFEAYDAGVKYATIAVAPSWPWQCSKDGEQLAYIDTRMGYVTKVDIAGGDSRLLASYQPPERENTTISFSPDLRSVATTISLKLTPDAGKLTTILVQNKRQAGSSEESVQKINWSKDTLKLFVAYSSTTVEVLDAGGTKIASGKRPKTESFRNGWFDLDQKALTLFLAPIKQLPSSILVKCRIAPWKCDKLKPRVDTVSIGGPGIMGTVEPLGKTQIPDDDSIPIYARYVVEIRNPSFFLLARQEYATADGRWPFEISISPSGTKAVVSWSDRRLAGCGPGQDSFKCAQGILINLSKVLK